MLTFEEYLKKKNINCDALCRANPELFSVFRWHYKQMGEKSFGYSKKYHFNKLRKQYPYYPLDNSSSLASSEK